MSDQAMKAEFADRIDRLSELVEAERELRAAMSNFEEAQRAVVQSAERLQDWADRWDDCRQRVLSVVADDDLTTQKATEYKLSDANDVMRRFCDEVELKREAIAALSVPEVAEVEIPDALAEFMKREGAVKWGGCDDFGTYPEGVSDDTAVEVIVDSGEVFEPRPAGSLRWYKMSLDNDIIAYRVLPIEAAAEAKGEDYLPEGFTRWSSDPHADRGPQPSGDMMVTAWMGGDDFVGPLPAKDFDWEHDTDPALGYKIDTSGETQGTLTGSAEREASNAFPGGVEGSRETSPSSDEIAAWPITTSAPNHNTQETAQDLPPLFPPEPPPAATPESLRAGGIVDSEASYWAGKLTTAQAGHVRKGWTL